ncbi:nectin-4 [Kryptolebias marmoratus]|uniref:Nectin cell adhesion molecule 4b n=1 Tax=Kryptolebias marmoratus TaxID=37003 RepID=A0A3Q3B419_KRYMA|nr:nectin-4 [Kryptolebias marmoratus]
MMERIWTQAEVLLLVLLTVASVQGDFVEPLQAVSSLRSQTESQTRLPCQYKVKDWEKVVQVTWSKELPDGTKEQIITAHFAEGQTAFGRYSGRVKFESSNPTEDSALLILSTQESDEGKYSCKISTFPAGNFERHIELSAWTPPIFSLDQMEVVEGQPYGVVAVCRAVGRPLPELSWDTDLPGKSQSRVSEGGSVSIQYSLHPMRDMNGKKLDCLVSHPDMEKQRRISYNLVVKYSPYPTITSPSGNWYVGLEKAELVCNGRGYPESHNIIWTWKGGALPKGVNVSGEKLVFERALHENDSGVYECRVKNSVGEGKAEYLLSVSLTQRQSGDSAADNTMLIIIGAAAGVAVVVLVAVVLLVRHKHQKKNKNLKMQLKEKTDEINSLSGPGSLRRLNSVSSDPRMQSEEYILVKIDKRALNSQMSLERPVFKDSQSTLGGKWGSGGVERDAYGRPVVWNEDRQGLRAVEMDGEKEERRRRVESYVKNSNMSLDSGLPSSLVPLKAQQDDCVGPREPDLGHLQEGSPPPGGDWIPVQSEPDGQEDDESCSSYQISEALANHFYFSNGLLRPRPHSNAILLHPQPQII